MHAGKYTRCRLSCLLDHLLEKCSPNCFIQKNQKHLFLSEFLTACPRTGTNGSGYSGIHGDDEVSDITGAINSISPARAPDLDNHDLENKHEASPAKYEVVSQEFSITQEATATAAAAGTEGDISNN